MKLGRFIEVKTELITILEQDPQVYIDIMNQLLAGYYEELTSLKDLLAMATITSPERVLDTVYHNDSAYLILVLISVQLRVQHTAGVTEISGTSQVHGQIGTTLNPTDTVALARLYLDLGGLSSTVINFVEDDQNFAMLVPPGWYYRAGVYKDGDGIDPSIQAWKEIFLFLP